MEGVLRGKLMISYHHSHMEVEEELIEGAQPHFTGLWKQNGAPTRCLRVLQLYVAQSYMFCFKYSAGA